jgi:hypothetical protein
MNLRELNSLSRRVRAAWLWAALAGLQTLAAHTLCALQLPSAAEPSANEFTLTGVVHGSQNHSYIKVPFQVTSGAERVTITFDYTARDQHTALDLGLLDPSQLRCWSGGNKSTLTVALMDATPSCLPGSIPAGEWNVLIGVPNIRAGVESHYTIHVVLSANGSVADLPAPLRQPLRAGPAWFRGDLHMHTAHSDGQCPSQTGKMVPCPVYFTVDAAARRGLDFIAVTDHNATSQYDAMRELQPYFDKVLLIPGREITTFEGHINLLGTTDFLDFRLDGKNVVDINTLLRKARELGALTSINHPAAPSGEICMGCGFTPSAPVDMTLFAAVEAVNGGSEQHGESEIPFWNKQLNRGCRLTAIGGSDNHRPMMPLDQTGSIGSPATVVYAADLSAPAILDAIRAGHVFIDVAGTSNRILDAMAQNGGDHLLAGDLLNRAMGDTMTLEAHVEAASGGTLYWIDNGVEMVASVVHLSSNDQNSSFLWKSDGGRHWLRAEVRGPDGRLWLIGNPLYVNWNTQNECAAR